MLRDVFLFATPKRSSLPRIATLEIPIKSRTRPDFIKIVECCCRLCFSPGILTLTLNRLLNRVRKTFAIRLLAEFGFFGDIVVKRRQTALFCGFPAKTTLLLFRSFLRLKSFKIWEIRAIIKSKQYWIRTNNFLNVNKKHYHYANCFLNGTKLLSNRTRLFLQFMRYICLD